MKCCGAVMLTVMVLATGCAKPAAKSGASAVSVPVFEGLGPHTRKVTTSSEETQRYFNQGLSFVYGFNHDEAIRSFQRAADLDSSCAMAWWGIALSNGPHINNPVVDEAHARAAWQALTQAQRHAAGASEVERALIEALGKRYADPQPQDRKPLDIAYADAMRSVWKSHPDDADVGALFAEAMMDLRPWDLWTHDGAAQPGTEEVVTTLETVLAKAPEHPLANHLYIHAVEASPHPEKADAAADRLRDMEPGLGHMVHMPSHIDVRRGRWESAIEANHKAIEADRRYREIVPHQGFYNIYMAHNRHMLGFAAMMSGQSQLAIGAMREMVGGFPPDWLRENAPYVDGYIAMPIEMLVRFGRWDEILAHAEPPEYFPLARAMRHAARGVACAAMGKTAEARAEQKAFEEVSARVPMETTVGNNTGSDILAIARPLLDGETLLREGKTARGLERLREAAKREDALRYDEPPDWIQPIRHALGAALLGAGRAAEAEKVYREDLVRLPDNGWSLLGLQRSLHVQGKHAEAGRTEVRFRGIWKKADVQISSSCFCQPGTTP